MRFERLDQWLSWQQQLHPRAIDLGLERIRPIAAAMGLLHRERPVVMIGGTNGKGSVVAFLRALYGAAGLRVGAYTSPHLLRYNERISIDGSDVDDAELCAAFAAVDQARGATSLTYFEFGTLAALQLLAAAPLDVELLEVGLGGRLDAVNVVDADCAVITAIDLDHEAWLGDSRERIGAEKAPIMRGARPAIIGDPEPPASVRRHAEQIGAEACYLGRDFSYRVAAQDWSWQGRHRQLSGLPTPGLTGFHQYANAASALAVVEALQARLTVSDEAVRAGISGACAPARCARVSAPVETIVDVAHNPAGITALAGFLGASPASGRTRAVLGMMQDKHHEPGIGTIAAEIHEWYVCALDDPRAADAGALADMVSRLTGVTVHRDMDVAAACTHCFETSLAGDRLVVFGSFVTVAEALSHPQLSLQPVPVADG